MERPAGLVTRARYEKGRGPLAGAREPLMIYWLAPARAAGFVEAAFSYTSYANQASLGA